MKNIISLKKEQSLEKNRRRGYVSIALAAAVFVALSVIHLLNDAQDNILFCAFNEVVLSVLSVIMTVMMLKAGFLTALILNGIKAVAFAVKLSLTGSETEIYPLIFTVTVLICLIIFDIVFLNIDNSLKRVIEENSERSGLIKARQAADKKLEESSEIISNNAKELYHLAFFDQLTDLANRVKIKQEINNLIEKNVPFSVIFIGLDNFKAVNESKGHDAGDKVLTEVSSRLTMTVEKGDICGRLGGDEFVIISASHYTDEECSSYIDEIYRSFSACFFVDKGTGIYINASFGTSIYPKDGDTCSKLLKNADIALNKAKNDGKNRYVLFDRNMQIEIDYHNQISMLMPSALDNNDFYLVYQPQFYPDKKLRGFEALLRWRSPQLGNISPVSFIPIAEETDFIVKLGEWIINTACRKLAEITEQYDTDIKMSVNISSRQFKEKNFVKTVSRILLDNKVNSNQLELEVTESLLLNSLEDTAEMLTQLKRMNISVSIDDFGTGYSSLNYLRILPIDTLKIDKSFIDVINEDVNGKTIVDTIIHMAHTLGMTVIAEGVEYTEQLEYLQSRSCDCIQGFLFSRPLEGDDAVTLAAEYGTKKSEKLTSAK